MLVELSQVVGFMLKLNKARVEKWTLHCYSYSFITTLLFITKSIEAVKCKKLKPAIFHPILGHIC